MRKAQKKETSIKSPERMDFQIVNVNADYIEFVVSYALGEDQWRVDGIGWMNHGKPSYYLRLLRLNRAFVSGKYYQKALLTEKNASFKFRNKLLESLTVSGIEKHFSSAKQQ